ncbi:MAG: Tex-like N-terminal domain-containing protein, partial [Prevotella sp.]|nr:Tex-like N-terminal domain-containing protein [Prevotella sp.]
MNPFTSHITTVLQLPSRQVEATLDLLAEGCTIPFIARYRKERTGGLDEVQIAAISDLNNKLSELQKRKETILRTIGEQGKLTDSLRQSIERSWDATEIEDIYLPYKPRRRTRAQVAREKGLEPLATLIMLQREQDPRTAAQRFVGKDVATTEEALQGAKDIIAEQVSEDSQARQKVRAVYRRGAVIESHVVKKKAEEEGAQKYSDYFDFSEELRRCSSHRLLAMRRGEAEGFLKVGITADDEECQSRLLRQFVRGRGPCQQLMEEAVTDGYSRLIR